MKYIDTGK